MILESRELRRRVVRAEMLQIGMISASELAVKLRKTISTINRYRKSGRISGDVFHYDAGLRFFPRDSRPADNMKTLALAAQDMRERMAARKRDSRPKVFIAAVDEMREKGLVCITELAEGWGCMDRDNAASLLRRKGSAPGVWHDTARMWFYPVGLEKPGQLVIGRPRKEPEVKNRRFTAKRKKKRGELIYEKSYKCASIPPGTEQVRLGSWAMWPAPGFVKFGMMGVRRNYRVMGRRSYGWFGASA